MTFIEEFEFIVRNLKDYGSKEWCRILWTAFCLHHNLTPDTANYDTKIKELYHRICILKLLDLGSFENPKNFEDFDGYMCEFLV